jgi:hypothetical protein
MVNQWVSIERSVIAVALESSQKESGKVVVERVAE